MMSEQLVTYFPIIFSVFIGSTIIALGIGALKNMRKQSNAMSRELTSVKRELNTITRAAMGMGQRLVVLEQRVRHMEQEPTTEEPPKMEEPDFAMTQALQMFDSGADANTVASHFGISRSEAELMALMRKNERNSCSTRVEPSLV